MVWPSTINTRNDIGDESYVVPETPGLRQWVSAAFGSIFHGTPTRQNISNRQGDNSNVYATLADQYRKFNIDNDNDHDNFARARVAEATESLPKMKMTNLVEDQFQTPVRRNTNKSSGNNNNRGGILKTPGTEGKPKIVSFARGFTPENETPENAAEVKDANQFYNTAKGKPSLSGLPSNFPGKFPSPYTPKEQKEPLQTIDTHELNGLVASLGQSIRILSQHISKFEPSFSDSMSVSTTELQEQANRALEYAREKDREASEAQARRVKMMEEFSEMSRNYEREIRRWIDKENGSQRGSDMVQELKAEVSKLRLEENSWRRDKLKLEEELFNLKRGRRNDRESEIAKDERIRELEKSNQELQHQLDQARTALIKSERGKEDMNARMEFLNNELRRKAGDMDYLKESMNKENQGKSGLQEEIILQLKRQLSEMTDDRDRYQKAYNEIEIKSKDSEEKQARERYKVFSSNTNGYGHGHGYVGGNTHVTNGYGSNKYSTNNNYATTGIINIADVSMATDTTADATMRDASVMTHTNNNNNEIDRRKAAELRLEARRTGGYNSGGHQQYHFR